MIREDFHVHTTFCDGEDRAETVVQAAVAMGMTRLGFSGHSHTPCDESYCMSAAGTAAYRSEIAALREKYRQRLAICCGIEQDYFADLPAGDYDYVIGSVHYLKIGGDYVPVDGDPEIFQKAAQEYFGGDFYAMAELYYRQEADVVGRTRADLIGHFDLIAKFNEGGRFFDESHPRYVRAATEALDALLETGRPFEVNSGAISRGWRTTPHPSPPLLKRIAAKGGRVVLSSDSHRAATLCYRFDECERLCASMGLKPERFLLRR